MTEWKLWSRCLSTNTEYLSSGGIMNYWPFWRIGCLFHSYISNLTVIIAKKEARQDMFKYTCTCFFHNLLYTWFTWYWTEQIHNVVNVSLPSSLLYCLVWLDVQEFRGILWFARTCHWMVKRCLLTRTIALGYLLKYLHHYFIIHSVCTSISRTESAVVPSYHHFLNIY